MGVTGLLMANVESILDQDILAYDTQYECSSVIKYLDAHYQSCFFSRMFVTGHNLY